ncbi:hypothetical protein Dimus_036064 [Dionaea muscipula]
MHGEGNSAFFIYSPLPSSAILGRSAFWPELDVCMGARSLCPSSAMDVHSLSSAPSLTGAMLGLSSALRGEVQARQHAHPQHAAAAHWFLEKKRGSYVLIMEMGLAVGVRC